MEGPSDKVMLTLQEIEVAAEDVLADKQQSIQLDKRRHQTREALRAIHNKKDNSKLYISFGNTFIKMPKQKAKVLLDKDFNQLDDEIDQIRVKLKTKVNKLRDLEQKEEIKGFNLKALSKEEVSAINSLL